MIASRTYRRVLPAGMAALALLVSGCEFDAYDLPLPGGIDEETSYVVTAEFADVLNVVPRSAVMVDDVPVGEVTEIERVGWHARVTMRVRDNVVLPDNATADIRQTSLLGEKYVALEKPETEPAKGRLGDHDNIPLAATGRNPEMEEVLNALSFLLTGGGVGQLATISEELNDVMGGRTGRLKHLLNSLDNVVGTLDAQKTDIIGALRSLNGLARTLNAERKTISAALETMPRAVAVLADQHADLMRMLRSLDKLGVVGTRVITASKGDLLKSLAHLKPILSSLRAAGDDLPTGLSMMLSFPFPKESQNVVHGDYANAVMQLDVSLDDLTLPGLPLPPPGQVLGQLGKCLATLNLLSPECAKFLTNLNLFQVLKTECAKPVHKNNPICQALGGLPLIGGLPDLLSGKAGLPPIPGLRGAVAGEGTAPPTEDSLYGGETGR